MAVVIKRAMRRWMKPFDWRYAWLRRNRLTRTEVIQTVIDSLDANVYLEIGVASGENIRQVRSPHVIGVDPCEHPNVRQLVDERSNVTFFEATSDEFFARHVDCLATPKFDVAFVDGLHTYEQSLRDCLQCLDRLTPGGMVLMHDCNPTTETMAIPASSFAEAVEHGVGEQSDAWTGDVWKSIVHLRALRPDVTACVLDTDFGLGVVIKRATSLDLNLSQADIQSMTYQDLSRDRTQLLGLRRPIRLFGILRRLQKERKRQPS